MTIIMNLHGELCGVHKIGSPGLNINRMMECIQRAKIKINKLSTLLKKELINADTIAKERLIVYANEKRNNVRDTMKNKFTNRNNNRFVCFCSRKNKLILVKK